MRNDDSMSRGDMQSLRDFIRQENRKLDNSMDEKIESVKKDVADLKKDVSGLKTDVADLKTDMKRVESKVDNLTDAVIEGFDNTEQILSDWEGKPVNLISKRTKAKLQNPKEGQANHE